MNQNIQKLYSIAQKSKRKIIGLMSGTSLDGLDIALCTFEGSGINTKVKIDAFETASYTEDLKAEIRKIFAKEQVNLQLLTLLNGWIGHFHGDLINDFLKKNKIKPEEVDIIASHGQTIFHAPQRLHNLQTYSNATLQIGDGDHLAVRTGIITFSDFRQKHVAAGGEGAPLAVYGDYLLFSQKGEDRVMLNIGGIANFTFLAGDLDANKMFSTDVGPGNTLIDGFVRKFYPEKAYDEDGAIASKGIVNEALLKELKSNSFFNEEFPKTTGPELFSISYVEKAQQKTDTQSLSIEDLIATLTRLTGEGIAEAVEKCFEQASAPIVYLSGGGMHNKLLINILKELLPTLAFKNTADLGINPDAKEAVLFAILANESLAASSSSLGGHAVKIPEVFMGKVSFPK